MTVLNFSQSKVLQATYLGDAVYMTPMDDLGGVWLFTTDGIKIQNEIYFEPYVWEAMIRVYGSAHPKTDKGS
jgi:hypothetical protein